MAFIYANAELKSIGYYCAFQTNSLLIFIFFLLWKNIRENEFPHQYFWDQP
jgi:hypothetical protein